MSKKIAYSEIKAKLETISELKTVRLWNNQIESDNKEIAFDYPCVFCEFSYDWTQRSYGNQLGVGEIVLYIAQKELSKENIDIFDLIEKVFLTMNGFQTDTIVNPLIRVGDEQDVNHGNIIVWKQSYTFSVEDTTGNKDIPRTTISPGTVEPEITKVIDIDDLIIRTGDGDFTP